MAPYVDMLYVVVAPGSHRTHQISDQKVMIESHHAVCSFVPYFDTFSALWTFKIRCDGLWFPCLFVFQPVFDKWTSGLDETVVVGVNVFSRSTSKHRMRNKLCYHHLSFIWLQDVIAEQTELYLWESEIRNLPKNLDPNYFDLILKRGPKTPWAEIWRFFEHISQP